MLFKAILIFSLGVLVGVFVIRSGKIGTKTAIILSLGFVGATFLYQYYSPYQTCVRGLADKTEKSFQEDKPQNSELAQIVCAKVLGKAIDEP